MDFGVSGNIKKVSHGPVVTLNEFEPAAGVKVSKLPPLKVTSCFVTQLLRHNAEVDTGSTYYHQST